MSMLLNSWKYVLAIGVALAAGVALSADPPSYFSPAEKAYYADQAQLDFIRPGLVAKITKADIAADGTIKAWVKFTDPKGVGLDRDGIVTPGPITMGFLIGYIPAGQTQYVSYITRQRTGAAGTVTQATGENTGTWTKIADGEYQYTFLNKAPASIDRNATHTVGIYGSRNLTEFDLGRNYADGVLNFVPSGAAVTKVRDVIRTASCNKCHDPLAMHGNTRRSVEVCNMCHTPQTPDSTNGVTTDMKVFIHKIHYASNLASVKAGGKYMVSGADFSEVVFPSPAMACQACHEDKSVTGATQADNWKTAPSRAACGSCHEDVDFASGKNHVNLPQVSDNLCAGCHLPKGEVDYDASIVGAHMVPIESSLLDGVVFSIDGVTNAKAGQKATVAFSVKDKKGNPVDIATMNSLRLYFGGPTRDIAAYTREDALKATAQGNGKYSWTFAAALPADAKGSFQFGIEGYRTTPVLAGTLKARTIRDYGMNKVVYASVDGTPVAPRRVVVATANCNKCHYSIAFHGGNRNTVEQCTFCHNANLTAGTPAESFNFVNMIHRFHEEAAYPGNLRDCNQCHVNNSQNLPLKAGILPTKNGLAPMNPTLPAANACGPCHNTTEAWSHMQANTTAIGESCSVCHGANKEFAVAKVHAN